MNEANGIGLPLGHDAERGGVVYILTNQAMPGFVKVGKSANTDVTARIRALNNTSVPFDFECYYAARVADCDLAEKLIHDAFREHRPNPRREFFELDPERVKSALRLAALEEVTPGQDDVIPDEVERRAVESIALRRRRTTLRDLGILPGAALVLDRDPNTMCEVVDDWNVAYDGGVVSLSAAAHAAINALGYDWPSANGWQHWTYEGERLRDLVTRHLEEPDTP